MNAMNGNNIQTAAQLGLFSCRTCGRVLQLADPVPDGTPLHCPRCGRSLRGRAAEFDA